MPRETVRPRSVLLLQELMKSREMSIRDLADRLPCGKSMVHALLSGSKQTCSAALGDRIAEVFGVAPEVLFAPAKSTVSDAPSVVANGRKTA